MLDRLFREENFSVAARTRKAGFERRADNVVEEESSVNEEREADDL